MTLQRLKIVFKTHLDLGFTDYASNVLKSYFDDFIPRAMRLAAQLREEESPERFRWTTGSWLIYQFLEEASPQARRDMEAAIEAGDIIWHALPFTSHTELMNAQLFRHGLSFFQRLDARFGKKTIAAKMTDVPGHTIAMLPLLAEAGVELLHFGVNEASTPPDVPPVFRWKHGDSAVNVIYESSYGNVTMLDSLDEALALIFTGDNIGPPNKEMVLQSYQKLRERFPEAELLASSMDSFAEVLRTVQDQLPVITAEIGDTWIQGAGTDPTKMRHYRALLPLAKESDLLSDALLLTAEHTWGMDEKVHLADTIHYENEDLEEARKTPKFQAFEASWQEQRDYIGKAVEGLQGTDLAPKIQKALEDANPKKPQPENYEIMPAFGLETDFFDLAWDETGALTRLISKWGSRVLADENHPFAAFSFEAFSIADYDRYWQQYIRETEENRWWALEDNSKQGMPDYEHQSFKPILQNNRVWSSENARHLLLELAMPEESRRFGAPQKLSLQYSFPNERGHMDIRLQCFEKAASRLPTAFWFSFVPPNLKPEAWRLEKMGQMISPLNVVSKGARSLHAIERGVFYEDEDFSLEIHSLDAPLVAAGQPSLLNFTNELPTLEGGMHFNLYNNVWGTNFPMWFEDDSLFRFSIRIGENNV
jgi:hypothetical protein